MQNAPTGRTWSYPRALQGVSICEHVFLAWRAPQNVRAAKSPPKCGLGFQVLRGDPFPPRPWSGLRPTSLLPAVLCAQYAAGAGAWVPQLWRGLADAPDCSTVCSPASPSQPVPPHVPDVCGRVQHFVFSGWSMGPRVCTLLCCGEQKRGTVAGREGPGSLTGPVGIRPTGHQLTWVHGPVSLGRALHLVPVSRV